MQPLLFFIFLGLIPQGGAAFAAEPSGTELDALVAKVGREAVLVSDLRRFADVDRVLVCAGLIQREPSLPSEKKALLSAYIDEELQYQEARIKKIQTEGKIQLAVQTIMGKEDCRKRWISLGERYSRIYRTTSRPREGEGHLVRELEKRVLILRFRQKESIPDFELWKREAGLRYPIKTYLE